MRALGVGGAHGNAALAGQDTRGAQHLQGVLVVRVEVGVEALQHVGLRQEVLREGGGDGGWEVDHQRVGVRVARARGHVRGRDAAALDHGHGCVCRHAGCGSARLRKAGHAFVAVHAVRAGVWPAFPGGSSPCGHLPVCGAACFRALATLRRFVCSCCGRGARVSAARRSVRRRSFCETMACCSLTVAVDSELLCVAFRPGGEAALGGEEEEQSAQRVRAAVRHSVRVLLLSLLCVCVCVHGLEAA